VAAWGPQLFQPTLCTWVFLIVIGKKVLTWSFELGNSRFRSRNHTTALHVVSCCEFAFSLFVSQSLNLGPVMISIIMGRRYMWHKYLFSVVSAGTWSSSWLRGERRQLSWSRRQARERGPWYTHRRDVGVVQQRMRSRRGQRRCLARREVSPSWSERQRRLQGLRIFLFEIFVEYAYVLESLGHIYSCKLNFLIPKLRCKVLFIK
jgi:hypothetical protein